MAVSWAGAVLVCFAAAFLSGAVFLAGAPLFLAGATVFFGGVAFFAAVVFLAVVFFAGAVCRAVRVRPLMAVLPPASLLGLSRGGAPGLVEGDGEGCGKAEDGGDAVGPGHRLPAASTPVMSAQIPSAHSASPQGKERPASFGKRHQPRTVRSPVSGWVVMASQRKVHASCL